MLCCLSILITMTNSCQKRIETTRYRSLRENKADLGRLEENGHAETQALGGTNELNNANKRIIVKVGVWNQFNRKELMELESRLEQSPSFRALLACAPLPEVQISRTRENEVRIDAGNRNITGDFAHFGRIETYSYNFRSTSLKKTNREMTASVAEEQIHTNIENLVEWDSPTGYW